MSVNKYQPHILVLPEDDANRQIANGFLLNLQTRQIQILPEAGGWALVRDSFRANHIPAMEKHHNRFMVLLVDFDGDESRLQRMKDEIPNHLADRVFVLGALHDPEGLRQAGLGSYEDIGKALAQDCTAGTEGIWAHPLLRHNEGELSRLCRFVRV